MCEFFGKKGIGELIIIYWLCDWLLSCQCFWGCFILIIYCEFCGDVLVFDDQLLVKLFDFCGVEFVFKGMLLLVGEEVSEWCLVVCLLCGGVVQCDIDIMDIFVDLLWYFMCYCCLYYDKGLFDVEVVCCWMLVVQYIGGVEYVIMYLLYFWFFIKVLYDFGMVDFIELFQWFMNQGQVINEGWVMLKLLGNGVDFGKQIDEFGVDVVCIIVIFVGLLDEDIDWVDVLLVLILKFLQCVWCVVFEVMSDFDVDLI